MLRKRYYAIEQSQSNLSPNSWDIIAFIILFALFALFAWGTQGIARPYDLGQALPIFLDPSYLPQYAIRTVVRMGVALFVSLVFSIVFGTWAAKNSRAEKIILPLIDILQSIPILVFLSFTVVWFVQLFPHSLLGPECAAIFVIFTSQAWNITIGFYQSLKMVPSTLIEAGKIFQLSKWQIFWKIEVPFALPSLLWNSMVSVSASWFFIIASEAISVANQDIVLPGIGSYISQAIHEANALAIFYAIVTMFLVILIYDQLFFRPLVQWSERFQEFESADSEQTWVLLLLKRTRLTQQLGSMISYLFECWVNIKWPNFRIQKIWGQSDFEYHLGKRSFFLKALFRFSFFVFALFLANWIMNLIPRHHHDIPTAMILEVFKLGVFTFCRIAILIVICSLIWVPVGIYIGLRPEIAHYVQPIAQFLAAIPANLLYPVAVIWILYFHLNVEIWLSPLMILGTQWYILFNVIAGASRLPKEWQQAAQNLGVNGWLWWKRLALPAVLPYYITGAMTAAGGAWNSSIVAEVVHWGSTTLEATGLGAYIAHASASGHFVELSVGTIMMSFMVIVINRLFWKPLFEFVCNRFNFD